jgi:hypothetical protein
MKENEKRRFDIIRELGLEEVEIEIVNSDYARGDARWKTWKWLRMGGHRGLMRRDFDIVRNCLIMGQAARSLDCTLNALSVER